MTDVLTAQTPRLEAVRPALIELVGVEKVYRTGKLEYPALRGIDLTIADGRHGRDRGPVGQRQVDDHEHDHRHRPPDGGHGDRGRRADRRDERGGARDLARPSRRRGLPVLPAAADAVRARERDAAARLRAPRLKARSAASARCTTSSSSGWPTRADYLPSELSGGQQQRVAIARALASYPTLVIGDEPTGNLDTQTAAEMFELLERVCAEGATVLYVTHDLRARGARAPGGHDPRRPRRGRVRRRSCAPPSSASRSRT